MRYKLDINGYIDCVLWGCNTGSCQEYTGAVPDGYETLTEWADKAIINAYYIDGEGNLTLDTEREQQIKANITQETAAYEPVVKKDLFAIEDTISSQYAKETATGKFVIIENAKDVPPMVMLSNLQSSAELNIFAHTKNMLSVNIEYVDFGSLTVEYDMLQRMIVDGWASEDLECTIAGSETNTTPLFALLANESYYLNLGSVECEMLYYNGETTEQIYSGGSGVISLSENKRVTQVKLKFPADSIYEEEIYPYLTPGSGRNSAIEGQECKTKILTIPLGSVTADTTLVIKDRMIAKVNGDTSETIAAGSMSLFNGYNLIYTDQGNDIFIEYSTDGMEGSVGGWKIDGNTLYCDIIPPDDYTEEDVTKIKQHIVGEITLTEEEKLKYDVSGDGKINSLDALMIDKLVHYNLMKSNPGKLILDTDNWNSPIRILNSAGEKIASFGPNGATPPSFPEQKVLWEGCYWMTSTHKCELSEAISKQPNGIVLCWSRYNSGPANSYWNYHFIPKYMVQLMPGTGMSFFLTATPRAGHMVGAKYLYISDELITGYDGNGTDHADTDSGLTLTNKEFVLRYVIGV